MTRLVATKLLAPVLPQVLVRRGHLHSNLAVQPGRRVSLVVGPPGAGKTTLVREWLAELPPETCWGWLSLDADDDDPVRLTAGLVAVVRAADESLARGAGDMLVDADADPAEVVAALVDEIAEQASTTLVIVLDDAHLVGDPIAWGHVAWLVDHQPAQLHVVICSRADPPLPFGRWRSRGQLGEVRAADISFDESESRQLLTQTVGSRANDEFCASVHDWTDGWAAGVRLASVALERGASPDEVIARFSHGEGTIAEMLVDEVLSRQEPDVRRFLLDTSVLETLEPAVCEALTGRSDAGLLLRRMASDHLFIRQLEGHRDQYRHHQLLAELLRGELRLEDRTAPIRLHRRAAAWYEKAGVYETAISHALDAGDFGDAVHVITEHLEELYASGHGSAMGRWLAAVPDGFITADPSRAVDHATALVLLARPEAYRWLRAALPLIPPDAFDLQARALCLDAVIVASTGRLEAFERLTAEAAALATRISLVDPFAERAEGWRARLLSFVGRHDEAIDAAERLLAATRTVLRDDIATSVLAGVLVDAEKYERAATVADHALRHWQADGAPALFGIVDALRARATIDRLAGNFDAAAERLEQARSILEGQTAHLVNTLVIIESAELDVAIGRVAEAVTRLDRLDVDVRMLGGDHRLLDRVAAARRRAVAAATNGSSTPTRSPQVLPGRQQLTERELVVLRYLGSHLTLPELATELMVSRNTIKTQVAAVYRKLGVSSRSDAVDVGRELGLVGSFR